MEHQTFGFTSLLVATRISNHPRVLERQKLAVAYQCESAKASERNPTVSTITRSENRRWRLALTVIERPGGLGVEEEWHPST
jgi:hypothetical protein